MKRILKEFLIKLLGIDKVENRLSAIENLILHQKSKDLGYYTLKKHLQRPDLPVTFMGKELEQD